MEGRAYSGPAAAHVGLRGVVLAGQQQVPGLLQPEGPLSASKNATMKSEERADGIDFLGAEVRDYWAEQFKLENYQGSTLDLSAIAAA